MIHFFKKTNFIFFIIFLGLIFSPFSLFAKTQINIDGPSILPTAEIFTMPHTGNFSVGSTFEVPIYINTKGNSINTISTKLTFDPTRLSVVKPSGGKSILGIWLEPPSYDNKKGTVSFVGVIPGGIVTTSGLISTVSFKALSVGETRIEFNNYSSANLNDGMGSNVRLILNGSLLNIKPRIPNKVQVYPETHPIENNSPVLKTEVLKDNSKNTKCLTYFKKYGLCLFIFLIFLFLLELILYYFFGIHIFNYVKKIHSDDKQNKKTEEGLSKKDKEINPGDEPNIPK